MKTEITVRCFDDTHKINQKLKKLGFVMVENYQLNDWYYSHLSNQTLSGLDFAEKVKNSVLVREIVEDTGTKILLTHKSKVVNSNGDVISESKVKTEVNNLDNTLLIFKNSGLNNWCKLKNNSFVYEKKENKEFSFVVQSVQDLGTFIEFEEYAAIKDLSAEEKLEIMKNRILSLGLTLGNDYSEKKAELMFNKTYKKEQ